MKKRGPYIKDNKKFDQIIKKRSRDFKPIKLSPAYSYLVQDNTLQLLIHLSRYKFVAKMLSRTDRVLEVGSGEGMGTIFLSQHCAFVKGIEFKKSECSYANTINTRTNVEFVRGDFFDHRSHELFDAVVNLDVIEHMPQDIGEKFLAKTALNLKDNGMMILGTPSIYSYAYQAANSKAGHVKCYDRDELVQIVKKYYGRVIAFSMNDEMVHTGFQKLAWYYFIVAFCPKR